MSDNLKPFVVAVTPKIRDSRNEYVRTGEVAYLDRALAEHYQNLGFLRVPLEDIFSDDEPTGQEPAAAAGSDDEGAASEDAETDAGADSAETRPRPRVKRDRARASG